MLNEIINDVIDMAEEGTDLYENIIIGNTPPTDGISVFVSSGMPELTDLEKGMIMSMNVMCNAKHRNQDMAFDALYKIHKRLTKTKNYPNREEYQIANIETITLPNLLLREENGSYVFGSTLNVKFYWRKDNGTRKHNSKFSSQL